MPNQLIIPNAQNNFKKYLDEEISFSYFCKKENTISKNEDFSSMPLTLEAFKNNFDLLLSIVQDHEQDEVCDVTIDTNNSWTYKKLKAFLEAIDPTILYGLPAIAEGILKTTMIIGGNDGHSRDTFINKDTKMFFNKSKYLIVGDDLLGTSFREIDLKLNGRIKSDTTIYINAHGSLENNTHYVELNHLEAIPTYELLEAIQKCTQSPIQVTLASCYAGNAESLIHHLNKGSTLITHSKDDYPALNLNVIDPLYITKILENTKDPYTNFLNSFTYHAINFAKFITSEEIFTIPYPSYNILLNQNDTQTFLEEESNRFIKFSKGKTWNGKKIKLSKVEFSNENIITFSKGMFLNGLRIIKDSNFIQFLHKGTKDKLSKYVNFENFSEKVAYEMSPLFKGKYDIQEQMIELFLKNGAKINQNIFGITPLIHALQHSTNKTVEKLLEYGADPNMKSFQTTPLALSIQLNKDYNIKSLLKSENLDINLQSDFSGDTALHIAIAQGNLEAALLLSSNGADHTITNHFWQTPLDQIQDLEYKKAFEAILAETTACRNINSFDMAGITLISLDAEEV